MKYIAAYALLVLGGNESPSDADVRKVLQEVGGEVNDEDLKRVVNALKGKQLHEVIAAGTKKLANISFGGASSGAASTGSSKAEPAKKEAAKEEKKPEVKEEEPDVGLGGGLFGEEEEW